MDNLGQTILISILSPSVLAFILAKVFKLGELHQQFKQIIEEIKALKISVSTLEQNVAVIRTFLVSKFGLKDTLFHSNSPISLSEKGKVILEESGFKAIYVEFNEMLLNKLRHYPHSTPAEIYEAATLVMFSLENDPILKDIKNLAYEKSRAYDELLQVCAIYLRDQAIKEILNQ